MFLLWLGEQITSRGLGNGVSLIIFSGIVAELAKGVSSNFRARKNRFNFIFFNCCYFILAIAVIVFIVFIERSQRKIVVQYPKRQMGNKMFAR